MVKKIIHKICKAIQWFKIGYKDYDYDYAYFLEIVSHKLYMMEKYFSSSNLTTNDELIASQIRKTKQLINAILEIDCKDLEDIHVNTRNIKRFLPKEDLSHTYIFDTMFIDYVYKKKAMTIVCNILKENIFIWWN